MARQRRRGDSSADLDVVVESRDQPDADERPEPLMPWWAAAAMGAVLTATVMWVLVNGLVALGWVAVPDVDPGAVFRSGTQLWLLTYFAGVALGGLTLSVPPLGLTLVAIMVGAGLASHATAQARLAAPEELTGGQRRSIALRIMAVFTVFHALTVLVPSFVVATADQSARALVGAVSVGLIASGIGAIRGAQWHVTESWPRWARPVPSAIAAGVLVTQLTGAVVLTLGLVTGRARITSLHASLEPGVLGSVLLVGLQVLWLPNLVVWCSSWALGSGFQLGAGSMVTPATTELGVLPTLPLLGAVPDAGPGPQNQLWWLLCGVIAGASCALVVLRARPRARFDETALVGGLTGVLAGFVVVGLGLLSSGDLGTGRLVGIGVRPTALFIMAPTLLGLSGVITGALWGLVRRPPRHEADHDPLHLSLRDETR